MTGEKESVYVPSEKRKRKIVYQTSPFSFGRPFGSLTVYARNWGNLSSCEMLPLS